MLSLETKQVVMHFTAPHPIKPHSSLVYDPPGFLREILNLL